MIRRQVGDKKVLLALSGGLLALARLLESGYRRRWRKG